MLRTVEFMGVKTTVDTIADRRKLVERAECGEINPTGFWANMRASWYAMTDNEKQQELSTIQKEMKQ